MKNKIKIIAALFLIAAVPFFSGCGTASQQAYSVNLEIWGPFDDSMVYSEIINQYKQINPYVGDIKYKKISQDTYKQELLDALAAGNGPDIFLINNTWLPSFKNKLQAAPGPLMGDQDMKDNFPDSVSQDFMDAGKSYAAPLSMDSLALYYNKDMFNAAGITAPPKTWKEFNEDVRKMTVINSVGEITQSGAALGTSQNVNRASDILSLLLLQNGVEMPLQRNSTAKFDQGTIDANGNVVQAGDQALSFYTQFSQLSLPSGQPNPYYSWNTRSHNSLDAFAEGSAAMMLSYSYQAKNIKNKNPKLNFGVAAIPQVFSNKPASYANYWGYAVSLNKTAPASLQTSTTQTAAVPNDVRTHEAWQFLRFLTLKNSGTITLYNAYTKSSKDFPINFDPAANYIKLTGQPAARRDLIETQKSDSLLNPFVSGNLIAKSWYQADPDSVVLIFNDAIDAVNRGDANVHDALSLVVNRINRIMQGGSLR